MSIKRLLILGACLMFLQAVLSLPAGADDETDVSADAVINVTDYGANGEDDEDDSSAIRKALTAAKNTDGTVTVYIPEGTYYIDKVLRIWSDTYLKLEKGTRIVRRNDEAYMFANGQSGESSGYSKTQNITIDGGIWDGNVSDSTKLKGIGRISNAQNVTIKNAVFTNSCAQHFVMLTAVKDASVTDCTFSNQIAFTGTEEECLSQISCHYLHYNVTEALHIDYLDKDSDGTGEGTPPVNITVSGCTFKNLSAAVGTHHNYDYMNGENISIINNTFSECSIVCINAYSYRNFTCSGNTALNCGTFLRASDTQGTVESNKAVPAIEEDNPFVKALSITACNTLAVSNNSNVEIKNNSFTNSTAADICVSSSEAVISGNKLFCSKKNSVKICKSSKAAIENNTISGCKGNGIYILSGSEITSFCGNTVSSVSLNGVYAEKSTLGTVENNIFDKCGSNGIYLSGDSTADICGNKVTNSSASDICVSSSKANITSNKLYYSKKNSIKICNSSAVKIKNNTVTGCHENGMYISGSSTVSSFSGNTVSGALLDGIYAEKSTLGTIKYNTIKKCGGNGICLKGKTTAKICYNNIMNCDLSGISLLKKTTAVISANIIYKCSGNAFEVMGAASAKIKNNTICSNEGYDLYATAESGDITFTSNGSDKQSVNLKKGCTATVSGTKKCLDPSKFVIASTAAYTGKQIKPKIFSPYTKNTDYTVSYGTNKAVGIGTVTVKGKGKYAGTFVKTFKITEK